MTFCGRRKFKNFYFIFKVKIKTLLKNYIASTLLTHNFLLNNFGQLKIFKNKICKRFLISEYK